MSPLRDLATVKAILPLVILARAIGRACPPRADQAAGGVQDAQGLGFGAVAVVAHLLRSVEQCAVSHTELIAVDRGAATEGGRGLRRAGRAAAGRSGPR